MWVRVFSFLFPPLPLYFCLFPAAGLFIYSAIKERTADEWSCYPSCALPLVAGYWEPEGKKGWWMGGFTWFGGSNKTFLLMLMRPYLTVGFSFCCSQRATVPSIQFEWFWGWRLTSSPLRLSAHLPAPSLPTTRGPQWYSHVWERLGRNPHRFRAGAR